MSTNGNGQFLEGELIHRKVKGRRRSGTPAPSPWLAVRLRLATRATTISLGLQTQIVKLGTGQYAVVKCSAGEPAGAGTTVTGAPPTAKGMPNWQTRLVELAETRSHRSGPCASRG